MRVAGIIPGPTGAAALFEVYNGDLMLPPGSENRVSDISDLKFNEGELDSIALKRWLIGTTPDYVVVPADPAAAVRFCAGKIEGIVDCLGIPLRRLTKKRPRDGLMQARELAGPDGAKQFLKSKKHEGRAAALLLAVWAAEDFAKQKRVDVSIGGKPARRRN